MALSTNWSSAKAQVLICQLAGFGAHIRWHSSQICPVLGCLHGDGSHASTEIQHLLPRAQLGEVEHQAGRGKTWAKSSTQNVHDFHPRSCISRKKSSNLLQHHSSPASLPAWRFLQKENATFARFYRSSKSSTWISSAFLSIKSVMLLPSLTVLLVPLFHRSQRRKCLASVRCQGRFSRGRREGFVAPRREVPNVAQEMPKVTWATGRPIFFQVKWMVIRLSYINPRPKSFKLAGLFTTDAWEIVAPWPCFFSRVVPSSERRWLLFCIPWCYLVWASRLLPVV